MELEFKYVQIYLSELSLEQLLQEVLKYTKTQPNEPRDIIITEDSERNCWDAKLYYFSNDFRD